MWQRGVCRRSNRSLSVLAAVLLCAAPNAAAGARGGPTIVFPPDRALVNSAAVDVLGYIPVAATGSLAVAGSSGTRKVPAASGSFKVSVNLDPGENVLTLGDKKVTVFLAASDAAAPAGFSAPDAHATDNGCDECHALTAAEARLLDPVPKLCSRCHDDVLKGKDGKPLPQLHPPAQEGDCLACHPFHGLAVNRLQPAAKRELCFGCHDDFTAGGKKKMHAPVAKGECTGCHGAHGSTGKKLLPASGLKLCLLCHANPSQTKNGTPLAEQHPALDDGCPSCHAPHVSDQPKLLVKPQAQVCAACHEPFPTEAGGKELTQHSPFEEGDCGACHGVHGSDAKKLLRATDKALCVKCHDDPTAAPGGASATWPYPHAALDDGCSGCHLPHVAPAAKMLRKATPPLCFECHDPFAIPGGGKGVLHLPVAKGNCMGCHGVHGGKVEHLLLAAPSRGLCLTCHKDPTRDPAGETWAVAHPALDDGCPSCHAPHVAAVPQLLVKPEADLCASCHEDKRLNASGEAWTVAHAPVSKGACSNCHAPHGSPEKALLKKSPFEICNGCHTELHEKHRRADLDPTTRQPESGKAVLPPGFPTRKTDGAFSCVGCHLPHGSENQYMWNRDEQAFCRECHTNF